MSIKRQVGFWFLGVAALLCALALLFGAIWLIVKYPWLLFFLLGVAVAFEVRRLMIEVEARHALLMHQIEMILRDLERRK